MNERKWKAYLRCRLKWVVEVVYRQPPLNQLPATTFWVRHPLKFVGNQFWAETRWLEDGTNVAQCLRNQEIVRDRTSCLEVLLTELGIACICGMRCHDLSGGDAQLHASCSSISGESLFPDQ